jgi:nucleotide-binding universal stress UspA family protein
MMIVLAYDLSPSGARAVALIAHTPWPAGTVVRIVTSPVGIGPGPSSFGAIEEHRVHDRASRRSIESAHARVAEELAAIGMTVESTVVRGGAASGVVREADAVGADLIVGGARNQGPMTATLLGSVSAEIVERARCSVLIARGTSLARVLLATDGSAASAVATQSLNEWPAFAASRIRVLGVGECAPKYAGVAMSADEVRAAYGQTLAASATATETIVGETIRALAPAHPEVEAQVRSGDAGREIIAAALEWAADLVILGSDRAPRRRRILLGSVARQVLQGIESSALTVRSPGPRPADAGELER